MRKINKWRIILLGSFGLFVLYEVSTLIYTWIDDQETSSKIPLTEYNNLFNKEAQGELQIRATVKSNNRPPVSVYVYSKRFNVCVFKQILFKNSDLKDVLNYKNETSYKKLNAVYSSLPSFNFDMSLRGLLSEDFVFGCTMPVVFNYNNYFISLFQPNQILCHAKATSFTTSKLFITSPLL